MSHHVTPCHNTPHDDVPNGDVSTEFEHPDAAPDGDIASVSHGNQQHGEGEKPQETAKNGDNRDDVTPCHAMSHHVTPRGEERREEEIREERAP